MAMVTLASGIDLDVERTGDPDGPTVLLIIGLGAHRTWWPPAFIDALVDRGYDVITYDNRDAGLSTGFEDHGPVTVEAMLDGTAVPAYSLADVATDAVQLLDALGVDRAHVVGASMGGMIAQHVAFGHPDRVRTLTSIMSNTGAPDTGQQSEAALGVLLHPPEPTRASFVALTLASARIIGSRRYLDEDDLARRAGEWFDRAYRPDGTSRQLAAILADGDRTDRLRTVTAPTLVIHGRDDELIQPDGGEATAAAIPNARLVLVDDMGHDLPVPLVETVVGLIDDHLRTTAQPSA